MRAAMVLWLGGSLVMTGCGGDSSTASGPAGSSASPTSAATQAGGSGACADFKAGSNGVVQVFCDGTGVAKVTVGAMSKDINGGTCSEQGGQLTLNFGVVTGPDFPTGSPKPDYLGALIPDGSSTAQAFSVHINGAGGNVVHTTASVSADKKMVTLAGTLLAGDTVSVTITC